MKPARLRYREERPRYLETLVRVAYGPRLRPGRAPPTLLTRSLARPTLRRMRRPADVRGSSSLSLVPVPGIASVAPRPLAAADQWHAQMRSALCTAVRGTDRASRGGCGSAPRS